MRTPAKTRVALVGAGYVSSYHIRALRTLPHVHIVGVADTSLARARALAERAGIDGAFDSLAALAEARPDVVHILTPHDSHAPLAVEALDRGCHVFVEKPMAATVAECDQMIAAAVRTGRVLSVNHSAKDDPAIVRALELLRTGACGDVLAVDVHRTSGYPPYAGGPLPAPFGQGGYPFLDLGVHALYLIEAFLGTIRDVDVRYRSTGMDPCVLFDEWRGTARCANGTGAFHLSWSARPIRNEVVVHGTRGEMHVDCFLQTVRIRRSLPGPKPIGAGITAMAQAAGTLWHVPKTVWRLASGSLRPSPGIHAGVLRFHEALARGTAPPVSMEEGRRIVAWLEPAARGADRERDEVLRLRCPLEPRPVLVTGGSGALGRALVQRLVGAGERVRVLVRRPSRGREVPAGVQVVYGDLGDPDAVHRAVKGVRIVYHVGATMRGGAWAEFEAGTVRGTANVVEACIEHGVERLVHVSSLAVLDYASQPRRAVVDEHAPLEPHAEKRGSYTRAKLLAERLVVDAARRRGLPAVVVRPGQITGAGYETVSPYGAIELAGRWIVVGSGKLKLPLVEVNDVVGGLLAAAERPGICGRVFQLVDARGLTQRDYIAACRRAAGSGPRATFVPRLTLLALGAALDVVSRIIGRGLPLSVYRVRSIKQLTFDCSAARTELGWRPSAIADVTVPPERQRRRSLSRAALARLARRTQMHLVWAPPNPSEPPRPDGYTLVRVGPDAGEAERELAREAMRTAGEPPGLVHERLGRGHELIGWKAEGRIVSFSWFTCRDRSVGPVRLADVPGRVFLYNAFTAPEHRGRGLFAAILLAARHALAHEGAREFIGDVNVGNLASARSLEKAGFVPIGRLVFVTLLDRWRWAIERTLSSTHVAPVFFRRDAATERP
jgi:predicted dehydrogenase/nucleoside-diphosphate-sugar epimerase